jgi:cytochrome b subunit of formate dehydrogenase
VIDEDSIVRKYNNAKKHVARGKKLSAVYVLASGMLLLYEFFVNNLSLVILSLFVMVSSSVGYFVMSNLERKLEKPVNRPIT